MATFVTGDVTVSVPASSANLGPGFDSLGLALELRDEVVASVRDVGLEIRVEGVGAGEVPTDEEHLVFRAMRRGFEAMGCEVPGVRLHCRNVIPHGRGLGSSSAAIVAGICAARALVAGGSLLMDDDAVFALAAELEGHPDNVAPVLYGGFTIACADDDRFFAAGVSVDPRVHVVVFVPTEPVETAVARALLPASVPHASAAANAGRAALLVAALNHQPELLLRATRDLLHQDYREPVMPRTLALVRELRSEGVPAVVSGAGPSVLAFADPTERESLCARAPEGWDVLRADIDRQGVRVTS